MIRAGLAWAFTRFSVDYVNQQEEARTANRGVHAHACPRGCRWRAEQRSVGTAPTSRRFRYANIGVARRLGA